MKLITLLLTAGLTAGALPSPLLAAKASAAKHEPASAAQPAAAENEATDGNAEQAKLSAAKRKVHALPEVTEAQQQAKADRAMAAKAAAEYKHARTKAAESETAYRKVYEEALAKQDPEAADLLKKQRAAFREKMLKARADKNPATGKKTAANDDEVDGPADRGEG
jgi:hypothetical protein